MSDIKSRQKILIITQKLDLNDGYFGFFHDWVKRFATPCDKVTVIALEAGEYNLPTNVEVLKLKKGSKLKSLYLLWKYSISKRKGYDIVFCHMAPIYVISGWLVWTILNKKIALWYVHRSVDFKLRIAHLLSDIVFTATPESFRIKSNKVRFMGQAIDIERFTRPDSYIKNDNNTLKIVTVGRITPIKNLDILLGAISIIKKQNIPVELNIIGLPVVASDFEYKNKLDDIIKDSHLENEIKFIGSIANKDIAKYYWNNDVCVNLAPTGGLDKTVLEAMAAEMPVVLVNKAFEKHLGRFVDSLLAKENNAEDFAQKLISLYANKNYNEIGKVLKEEVKSRSSLDNLIYSIVNNLRRL